MKLSPIMQHVFCVCERQCGRGLVTSSLCAAATRPRWRRSFRRSSLHCWRSSWSPTGTIWFAAVFSPSPSSSLSWVWLPGSNFLVLDLTSCGVCVFPAAWWVTCSHSGSFVQPKVLQVVWRTFSRHLMIYSLRPFFPKLFCDWTVVHCGICSVSPLAESLFICLPKGWNFIWVKAAVVTWCQSVPSILAFSMAWWFLSFFCVPGICKQ